MEKEIKERYNDDILKAAMQRFGIRAENISLLDGFESFIYAYNREGNDYILRIGHSRRRSEALIQGEVDWINYLARGGAGVAPALLSEGGKLVEPIDDGRGGQFLATAFEKAPGKPPWEIGWSPRLYQRYGELLGRMHALSHNYRPTHPLAFRPQWDDPLVLDVEANLPAAEHIALERFHECIQAVKDLPKGPEWYGMVHFDPHAANLFVDRDGQLTLFDFDDCQYNWYAYDIAIMLFYKVMGEENTNGYTQGFMKEFLTGYQRENAFNPEWLAYIPVFLKMREIDLYAVIHRSFDVENLDDPWNARYMAGRKEQIEKRVPYIDMDFGVLEQFLSSC